MARPVRIELPGAIYHITSRGDYREDVFIDDDDRAEWLKLLGRVCGRFNWKIHVYCMMNNHYHLVLETAQANLSKGMRQLNGVYTQYFNRRHQHEGPVFHGRFRGIVVEKEAYLLELSRFVVLNPLRSQIVEKIENWKWSSYLAYCGKQEHAPWLDTSWVFGKLAKSKSKAMKHYPQFVREGVEQPPVWLNLRKQIYLGSDQFVEAMQLEVKKYQKRLDDNPNRSNRAKLASLAKLEKKSSNRNHTIREAYASGRYTLQYLGEYFGLHYTSISRIINSRD